MLIGVLTLVPESTYNTREYSQSNPSGEVSCCIKFCCVSLQTDNNSFVVVFEMGRLESYSRSWSLIVFIVSICLWI